MTEVRQAQMHRRKSSKDEDENVVVVQDIPGPPAFPTLSAPPSRRRAGPQQAAPKRAHTRAESVSAFPPSPATSSPLRPTFPSPRAPPGLNGHPSSPFRASFSSPGLGAHARTRSTSTPFSPPLPSPLSASFPAPPQIAPALSNPETNTASTASARRHARLHSRNLSVFFPRPGAAPPAIAEDGQDVAAPETLIPRGAPTPLGAGFTFGGRPPGSPMPPLMSGGSSASRRGHHHKHSMSHSFFSFLEPGDGAPPADLHTQPTPTPVSPWTPISPFPTAAAAQVQPEEKEVAQGSGGAAAAGAAQFVLGAWLWVAGQQAGSLATTALGYWVVFDAFGVGLAHVLPDILARKSKARPYGAARATTVFMFAQTVYLLFAAVYVCKETVEHLLLRAGGADASHHHHSDEAAAGLAVPAAATLLALLSVAATALLLDNNGQLADATGTRLTPPRALPRSLHALANPFAAAPLALAAALLALARLLPPAQQRAADAVLAAAAAVATFRAAYAAAAPLGAVLLQTAPPRGRAGRMEAFLRAMRDVERAAGVLHLPAPHLWERAPGGARVATLEVHVKAAMGDAEAVALARWARERVGGALGEGAEVTVGVVRG